MKKNSTFNLPDIKSLSCDTRTVIPGDIFVVIPCDQAYEHAKLALKKGAEALVCEHAIAGQIQKDFPDTKVFPTSNPRLALSQLACHLYPKQPEVMLAVTGTNGKSSVVTFIRQIWEQLGYAAVSMGTLGVELSSHVRLSEDVHLPKLTTPDAISLHRSLHQLAEENVTHCAFEVTSHGLDQCRSHGARLTVAGFTNLTQDHLDYHQTIEDYFSAKCRLFTEILPQGKTAVINAASPYFSSLNLLLKGRGQHVLSFGVDCDAHLKASRVRLGCTQISFDLSYHEMIWPDIVVNVVGNFQIENILCAIGMVMATGVSLENIIATLPHLRSAQGRMQLAGQTSSGANIFVDYAHTPDALLRALTSLRPHIHGKGKLGVIFGCGGNRDVGKRAIMGEIADQHADKIYITDDNPRHENPAFIRAQILTHCQKAVEMSDRRTAIDCAIQDLQENDVLLIAGKGHEQGQIIADRVIPFDDAAVVQEILNREAK